MADRSGPSFEFAVVDVETTGLGRTDRIVEFACEVIGIGGRVVRRYETLVDPGRRPGPSRVHGITREMLSAAPRFLEVGAEIGRLLRGRVVVAHHLSFDWGFIREEFRRVSVDVPPVARGVCTAQLVRLSRGGSARLQTVCRDLGIDYSAPHSAANDARAAAQVFLALRMHLGELPSFRPSAPFRGAWRLPRSASPVPRPSSLAGGWRDL